ncbi:hypothetical protein E0494_02925 [Marinilabiliaceae bacterium JC040]|nr:hypothetical protein [Marinilabiliaceae bacterium JC040]
MRKKKLEPEIVYDLKELILKVFIIGYSTKGESIVVFVCNKLEDNVVLFSAVIDCFELGDINKTIEILKDNSIAELNLFCWTHPDEDHTLGILNVLNDFCSNNTKILLPEGVTGSPKDVLSYDTYQKSIFAKINENNTKRLYNVKSVSVGDFRNIEYKKIIKDSKAEIVIEVFSYTPNSSIIRRRIEENKCVVKNDYSIALLFDVGDISLFFSGDIEDQTIGQMSEEGFEEKIDLLKTPHHTSDSSGKLLDILDKGIIDTCTTTYKQNGLPKDIIVKKYMSLSNNFYSTGYKTAHHTCNYGIIKYEYNIISKSRECSVEGHAEKL